MVSLVIAFHIMISLSLVVVVLLQQGKGADVGAVFGGSSTTLFGASGAGNVLTKTTYALAVVFFATSIYLAYASSQRATGSLFNGHGMPRAAGFQPKVAQTPAVKAGAEAPKPASAPPVGAKPSGSRILGGPAPNPTK